MDAYSAAGELPTVTLDSRLEPTTDDAVVDGCRRGDPDAQQRLFQRYNTRVYRLALYMSRNPDDAAEITQQVFCKIYAALPTFRGDSTFDTWLYRIVTNTCRDQARRRRRFLLLDSAFWARRRSEAAPPPDHNVLLGRGRARVRRAVASLPEKLRIVVVLRYVQGLSYEEIGKVLECPPGTIAARLNRAHRQLARKLATLGR